MTSPAAPAGMINLFSSHYKQKYGKSVGKVALDMGNICPNRAKGGCVYCRPASFTPFYSRGERSIEAQLESGLAYLATRKFHLFLGYFQQETATAAPEDQLFGAVQTTLSTPGCVGVIISTRPDYIHAPFLAALAEFVGRHFPGREVLVELGLQSSHEKTLQFLNRNHTYGDFVRAVEMVKAYPTFHVGCHLILGLPGEEEEEMRQTIRSVSALGVDAVKFHHLQVIKETPLAQWYEENRPSFWSASEYLQVLARLLAILPSRTVIHRLWSSAAPDLLIAPRWGIYNNELARLLEGIMIEKNLWQGKCEEERDHEHTTQPSAG